MGSSWLGIESLELPGGVAYLATVAVPPEYRGRLIAKRGLKFIENYLLEHTKINKLFAVVAPDNTSASRIFEICGYLPYQQVKYFYFRAIGIKLYIVGSLNNKKPKQWKLFIQRPIFWNCFSSILNRSGGV